MASRKAEREQRLADWATRVRQRGEFVHRDKNKPHIASGDFMPRGTLKALTDRGVLVVVQSDLLGMPYQYGVKRTARRVGR